MQKSLIFLKTPKIYFFVDGGVLPYWALALGILNKSKLYTVMTFGFAQKRKKYSEY
jgi:hypothetical protein